MSTKRKQPSFLDTNDGERIQFRSLGSGREVGRSCHWLTIDNKNIILDCGVHPSLTGHAGLPLLTQISDFSIIDLVLITHFHLDHVAALPFLMKRPGFRAKVYMTHPTRSITQLMLEDYLRVTSFGVEDPLGFDFNRDRLFTDNDLRECLKRVKVINFHEVHTCLGIKFWALYAGHVLGAAMFMIEVNSVRILYTGDYSRTSDRHLPPAEIPQGYASPGDGDDEHSATNNTYNSQIDILIMEGTHGTQTHASIKDREHLFTSSVHRIVKRGGKCLIPQFALGRAQELFLILDEYWAKTPSLMDVPIYFTSALAHKCMSAYQSYITFMSEDIKKQAAISSKNPFELNYITCLPRLASIQSNEPCVVFASPGMLQSGLSRDLFEEWCSDPRNGVVIAGYCTKGTLAHDLQSNPPRELHRRDGQIVPILCSIDSVTFSAHADFNEAKSFVNILKPKNIVIVHGAQSQVLDLQKGLAKVLTNTEIYCPANAEIIQMVVTKQKIVKTLGGLPLNNYLKRTHDFSQSYERSNDLLFQQTSSSATASNHPQFTLLPSSDDAFDTQYSTRELQKWKLNEPENNMVINGLIVQNKVNNDFTIVSSKELLTIVKDVNVITQKTSISTTLPYNVVITLINSILEITYLEVADNATDGGDNESLSSFYNGSVVCTFAVMDVVTVTASVDKNKKNDRDHILIGTKLSATTNNNISTAKHQKLTTEDVLTTYDDLIATTQNLDENQYAQNFYNRENNGDDKISDNTANVATVHIAPITTYTLSWATNPTTDIIVDCICAVILGAQLNPTAAKILGCASGCDHANADNSTTLSTVTTATTTTSTNVINDTSLMVYDKNLKWSTQDLFSFYYELTALYSCRVVKNQHEFFNTLAQYFIIQSPVLEPHNDPAFSLLSSQYSENTQNNKNPSLTTPLSTTTLSSSHSTNIYNKNKQHNQPVANISHHMSAMGTLFFDKLPQSTAQTKKVVEQYQKLYEELQTQIKQYQDNAQSGLNNSPQISMDDSQVIPASQFTSTFDTALNTYTITSDRFPPHYNLPQNARSHILNDMFISVQQTNNITTSGEQTITTPATTIKDYSPNQLKIALSNTNKLIYQQLNSINDYQNDLNSEQNTVNPFIQCQSGCFITLIDYEKDWSKTHLLFFINGVAGRHYFSSRETIFIQFDELVLHTSTFARFHYNNIYNSNSHSSITSQSRSIAASNSSNTGTSTTTNASHATEAMRYQWKQLIKRHGLIYENDHQFKTVQYHFISQIRMLYNALFPLTTEWLDLDQDNNTDEQNEKKDKNKRNKDDARDKSKLKMKRSNLKNNAYALSSIHDQFLSLSSYDDNDHLMIQQNNHNDQTDDKDQILGGTVENSGVPTHTNVSSTGGDSAIVPTNSSIQTDVD